MPRIGELLVAEGVLSEVAVQSALGFQRHTGEPFRLGTILLDRDLLPEDTLMRALSSLHRCDSVKWSEILKAPPSVVRLLPERTAVRLAAIPYGLEGRGLRVAFKNPSNLAAVDEVSAITNRPVVPAVISEVRLLQALHLFYGRPIPIEFRSVLQKLERNEERRLYRTRATQPSPPPPLLGRFVNPASAPAAAPPRPIPIEAPAPPAPRAPDYSAPFASAETAPGELAEAADLLPDFAPPRRVSPEELAASMWTDSTLPNGATQPAIDAMWAGRERTDAERVIERYPARDRVAESTIDSLAALFPHVVLLTSAQDAVLGWTGRGAGLTRGRVGAIRIPWGEPSIFAFVKLSGTPHRGPLSRILMPHALGEVLGPRASESCAVYPVRIKDRVVAFLYADRLGAPLSEEDFRDLEVAASSLGSALARLLLELRRAVPAAG